MKQLSRERLEEIVSDPTINQGSAFAKMARRLLAVEGQEPVLSVIFKDGWPIEESVGFVTGSEKLPDGAHDFYAAPPAPVAQPVAVPDEVLARLEHEANHLTAWHHMDEHSCKVNRRDLLTLVNACRAAMLAAEPVSQPYKLPDGWKLVPVEPTLAMLTVLGFTGSFESMKQRYEAMLAAAPQEPIK